MRIGGNLLKSRWHWVHEKVRIDYGGNGEDREKRKSMPVPKEGYDEDLSCRGIVRKVIVLVQGEELLKKRTLGGYRGGGKRASS